MNRGTRSAWGRLGVAALAVLAILLAAAVAVPAVAPHSPASSATAQGQSKEPEKLPDLTPPASRPEPVVKGYVLHLKNGRRISTFHYEDKGDQVVIPQHGGTYGLSKSLIARIEVVKENP